MKFLRYAVLAFAWVAGLSIVAFAQNDQRDPPPKKDPPVVVVKDRDKDKPKDKPKDDNRGKDSKPNKPDDLYDPASRFFK